jgi:uncharacterized protein YecA (UPF0149 family)
MKTLKSFAAEFEKKFDLIEEEITESKLESMYLRGQKCAEKAEQIGPYYEDYKTGKTSFRVFSKEISAKCSQIDKDISKAS